MAPTTGTFVTNYTYDVFNHLTQVSMPRNTGVGQVTQTRTFTYGTNNMLQSAANPENGTLTYTYNPDNTLATKTDASGQVVKYAYDSFQRVLQVQRYPTGLLGSADKCQEEDYIYDSDPNYYSVNALGRLVSVDWGCVGTAASYRTAYKYTSAGLITAKRFATFGFSGQTFDILYNYSNDGAVLSITYPIGEQLTYGFDTMGRQKSLSDTLTYPPTNLVTNAAYNAANQLTQITYGNSTTETRTYNTLQQLTGIQMPGMNMQYVYSSTNNNGQIAQAIDLVLGEQITYQYDALKRLISAASSTTGSNPTPIWGQTFNYDGFSNLTDMSPTTGAAPPLHQVVDPHSNQITPGTYDPNGNPTISGYTYDVENRLITAGSFSATYGPDNKRVLNTLYGGQTQLSLFGIDGKLAATYLRNTNGTFTLSNQYRYFVGKLVAQGPASNYPVATDRLGSVRYTSGAALRFYPYGQDFSPPAANDQKKFGTYMRDRVTGLDYADQRYYSSTLGRFMTVDPSSANSNTGNPGTLNRYAYTNNDPASRNDPSGLGSGRCVDGDYDLSGNCSKLGGTDPFIGSGGDIPLNPGLTLSVVLLGQIGLINDIGPPPPSTTGTTSSKPTCAIEFGDAPALNKYFPGRHTFFYVEDHSGWNVVDAGPEILPPVIFRRPWERGRPVLPVVWMGFGRLKTNVSPHGLYGEDSDPESVITFFSPEPCTFVDEFEKDAHGMNLVVPYSAPSIGQTWYNSNSFTYTLSRDFSLPIIPGLTSPGWGNYIPR